MARRAKRIKRIRWEVQGKTDDEVLVRTMRLFRALLDESVSQQGVAEELGVSKPTITRWLQGQRRPSPENLDKLQEALQARLTLLRKAAQKAEAELEAMRERKKA